MTDTTNTIPYEGRQRTVRVVVLASDADGVPTFVLRTLTVTNAQYDDGQHYDLAKHMATREGYEAPMVAFDEFDTAGQQCDHLARWFKQDVRYLPIHAVDQG